MDYLPENNDDMLGRCLAPPSCCPLQAAAPQPRWVVGRATDGQRQTTDGGERGQLPGQAELLESKLLQAAMMEAALTIIPIPFCSMYVLDTGSNNGF